jgi:hypothetical protein
MHVWEENKRKKKTREKETKQKKQKLDTREVKNKNKINIIIYTRIYLPGNGAKNSTWSKSWCLIPSAGVSP